MRRDRGKKFFIYDKFAEFVLRDKGKVEELEGFYLMNIKPMNSDKLGVSK